ncbi:PEP-CTERM sorting domain-containing protein [Trichocoleus sp. FACHB-90]|uniref:PEP-CTERM sorting domain-containing protein n=1 Tax=Cyanophyceae TaxID=3028117 RepID=UPI001687AC9B|nr:PEP-CTERM sorting domain-containing protein [Trichocoleus sp. FACHB-90]MBD1929968.1 PEP-CTERM sorting domain-containing protein [Trichocoleus sp. FACHB-90]
MLRQYTAWLVPVAFTLVGFGPSVESARAQITYPFSANYDLLATSSPITPEVLAASISGESTDALYGLSQISGLNYAQIDFTTGLFRFNTDPTTFGLQNLPFGEFVFFGSGSNNKLFATENDTGMIDFETLRVTASGVFTITGGEGIFTGAIGQLALFEEYTLSLDPTVPTRVKASLNGSIQVFASQTVPEPRTAMALVGMGVISTGVLVCRRKLQSTSDV